MGQRRVSTSVLVVAALVLAFAAGALTATTGSNAAPPAHPGVLDDAAAQISAQALRPVTAQALDAAAIAGMLRAAGDSWGSWSDADPDGEPGAAGIGIWLRTARTGAVLVARVEAGTAAAQAGLQPGDAVRSVDGRSTAALTAPLVAAALRGSAGSVVRLTTERDDVVRSLVLRRAVLPPDGVSAGLEQTGTALIGHLTVPAFPRGTGRAVAAAVSRLRAAHAAGVILDLRGNPGGLLAEAVETVSVFLDGGPVVSYRRRGGAAVQLAADPGGDTLTPLVVLVDGGTASAAEVVAGALQDRNRAVLVGSRTFGKGTVQEPRTLADGSALELTVASYATPAGRSVDGVGLAPDIEIPAGSAGGVAVRRAWEVLSGLVADSTPVTGGRG